MRTRPIECERTGEGFSINQPIGTNWRADSDDIINTKWALAQLGHYKVPADRGIDDWADGAMFDGIRNFQKDNGLKVDGFMRPGGPTESALNKEVQGRDLPQPQWKPEQQDATANKNEARIAFLESQINAQRERVRQMKAAGADPSAIKQIEFGIRQMEVELRTLKGEKGAPIWWPF